MDIGLACKGFRGVIIEELPNVRNMMLRKVILAFTGFITACVSLLLILLFFICIAAPPLGLGLIMMGVHGIQYVTAGINHLSAGHMEKTGQMPAHVCFGSPMAYKDGRILILCDYSKSALIFDSKVRIFSALYLDEGFKSPIIQAQGSSLIFLPDERLFMLGGSEQAKISSSQGWDFIGVNDIKALKPSASVFSTIGHLQKARYNHSSILLNDGKILVLGGENEIFEALIDRQEDQVTSNKEQSKHSQKVRKHLRLDSAELIDPTTGKSSLLSSHMLLPRSDFKTVLLKDGRVLILGGVATGIGNTEQRLEPTFEFFDPKTLMFSSAGKFPSHRSLDKVLLLPDGQVLITSYLFYTGRNADYFTELYNPLTQRFSSLKGSLYPPIAAAITLENGKVLLFGRTPKSFLPPQEPLELFDPKDHSFQFIGNVLNREGPNLVPLSNRRVLILGQTQANKDLNAEIYAY